MSSNTRPESEGITWISAQSLIQLRVVANQIPLNSGKIHAKQGGAYLSSFKGRGMEFDESRIYQAGDDIRNMDWRVTARTGNAHSKTFREERERPVLLCLDLCPSMMFATRKKFKSVIATQAATILAWSAAINNDRVGGLIYSPDEQLIIKPRRGKTAVLDLIGRCSKHRAWNLSAVNEQHDDTDNNKKISAIARLRKITHPGSLIFIISDFQGFGEKDFSQLANTSRNNDLIFIKVSDPFEVDLPVSGSYKLSDGKQQLQLNTDNKKVRQQYHQHYLRDDQHLQNFCRKHRIHLIHLSTDDDVVESLKQGLGVHGTQKKTSHRAQYRSA